MANWRNTIRLGDLVTDSEDDAYAIEIGKKVADRLSQVVPTNSIYHDREFSDILDGFRDDVVDTDTFNYYLGQLYDWGDYRHRLFIDTFLKPEQV